MIVEDANEQAPVFDMGRYSGSVLEGQRIGQFVLRVRRDGEIGRKGKKEGGREGGSTRHVWYNGVSVFSHIR